MPNQNLTLVAVVLDRSGSMAPLREATIAGLNEFLDIQRKSPGDVLLHLVQFDDKYDIVRDFTPLSDVKPISHADYEPRGWTALMDAMGRTINDVGNRLKAMPEATRPGKVVMVIQTDGQENYSKEYARAKIMEMVIHQREKYQWEFVFLGANIDAMTTADSFGILRGSTMQYTANVASTKALYGVVGRSVSNFKSGVVASVNYSAEDRAEVQKSEDPDPASGLVVTGTTSSDPTP